MKLLSIDVGIKNLAVCLFEKQEYTKNFKILKWDVINIAEKDNYKCCIIEKNKQCNSTAKYIKNSICFCLKHAKKQSFQIPNAETKPAFINKQKIQKLNDIANKYNIVIEKQDKKTDIVNKINDHIHNAFFEEIGKTDATKVDLVKIGKNLATKFNDFFSDINSLEYIIIENQISPIANKMKTIQGMIVQYFIMSKIEVGNIEFISAINKLKGINKENNEEPNEEKIIKTDKEKYNDRKKLGITTCLHFLSNDNIFSEKKEFFINHKKKDDLADSFLQGIWFINNKI
jgi:hypothetical protein